MTIPLLFALAAILTAMALLWLVSLALKNASIADIFWGPLFAVQALVYFYTIGGAGDRRTLVLALVAVWAARLSMHIAFRNAGRGEDYRYREWRRQYGESYWWVSGLQVFLLQGMLSWIIGIPLLAAMAGPDPDALTLYDLVGSMLWLGGFLFETVGDFQLRRFKADPANRGKVLRTGLWAWTRHPNYFGDAVLWWGLYVIAAGTGGWWTVFGPAIMTLLLMKVSGVSLLERTMAESKPGYRDYMESTNAFIPWFPRRK